MSECVVRMKMPESCDMCPCLDDYGDYPRCRISGEQRGYNFPIREKRMPNCPIVCALPDGHGRLVDAGRFERNMYFEWANGELSNSDWIDFRQWLKDEETVVPASNEERSKNESD